MTLFFVFKIIFFFAVVQWPLKYCAFSDFWSVKSLNSPYNTFLQYLMHSVISIILPTICAEFIVFLAKFCNWMKSKQTWQLDWTCCNHNHLIFVLIINRKQQYRLTHLYDQKLELPNMIPKKFTDLNSNYTKECGL